MVYGISPFRNQIHHLYIFVPPPPPTSPLDHPGCYQGQQQRGLQHSSQLYQIPINNNTSILNEYTTLLIIILNCNIFGIMMYNNIYLFTIQILNIPYSEVLYIWKFQTGSFELVFDLALSLCKNHCMYLFLHNIYNIYHLYHNINFSLSFLLHIYFKYH